MTRDLNKLKILFAPHEIGGQMKLMVEELRRRGHYATNATYSQESFGYVNDIHLNLDQIEGRFKRHLVPFLFTLWAANNYDIFHFFWGESLFRLRPFTHLDLRLLRRMGKKIFVHFRGIDIVDLAYFDYLRARTAGDDAQEPPMSRPDQLQSVAKWRRYSDGLLVSEPDLLRVVPEAVMVQQAIQLDQWQPSRPHPKSHEDGIIRIAHAPSLRRKKGTEFVEQSVAELKSLGYPVELVLIEKQPFYRVKENYELCDIGVDQVLYGWYGKVSIELMTLGRPVVCYIDPELAPFRSDMPIISADPHDLTSKLKELVENIQLRQDLGRKGQQYVKRYHDVRSIVDQTIGIYEESFK